MSSAPPPSFTPPRLTRAQILSGMALTAIALLGLARLGQALFGVPILGWQWSLAVPLLGIGVGVMTTLVSLGLYRVWPAYRTGAEGYLTLVLEPLLWVDLLWLGLLPGLSEELLFRGVMLPGLGGGVGAVLGSSLCFGLLHMTNRQQWPYALWATVVGIIFASLAIATGNLLIPVMAHMTTNVLSGCLWKLMIHKTSQPS